MFLLHVYKVRLNNVKCIINVLQILTLKESILAKITVAILQQKQKPSVVIAFIFCMKMLQKYIIVNAQTVIMSDKYMKYPTNRRDILYRKKKN